MDLLTREEILRVASLPFRDVPVPRWKEGASVRVRCMSGADRDQYEAALSDKKKSLSEKLTNIRAKVVCWCAIDEKGKRLFADADVATLGAKDAETLDELFQAVMELSGLTKLAAEETEKNSATPTDGGGSSGGSASASAAPGANCSPVATAPS